MQLIVLKQAQKELQRCPEEFSGDIYSLFSELAQGKRLEMPIARSLSSIRTGLFELRLSGRSGELRVFYFIQTGNSIWILHAALKKTQKLSQQTVRLLKLRLKAIT